MKLGDKLFRWRIHHDSAGKDAAAAWMDGVSAWWSWGDLIENTCAAPGTAKEEMTASNSCLLFKVKSRDIKLSIINYSFIEELIIVAFLGVGGCMNLPCWGLVIEMQFSIPILTQSRVEETAF